MCASVKERQPHCKMYTSQARACSCMGPRGTHVCALTCACTCGMSQRGCAHARTTMQEAYGATHCAGGMMQRVHGSHDAPAPTKQARCSTCAQRSKRTYTYTAGTAQHVRAMQQAHIYLHSRHGAARARDAASAHAPAPPCVRGKVHHTHAPAPPCAPPPPLAPGHAPRRTARRSVTMPRSSGTATAAAAAAAAA